MAELARAAAAPRSVEEVLADVTAAAKELIPGVDTAGVLLIGKGGKFEIAGGHIGTAAPARRVADEVRRGSMRTGGDRRADRAHRRLPHRDERWPKYSPAVVEIGVLSGLSFKLYTADRTAGALNLFGFKPNAFDGEAETIGVGARRARRRGDPGQPSG